ncbi:hypothetical protein QQ008_05800 [Fulvivirgaceae bacterium BMA10]|uniref:Lipoprotein n=1 Tax=Splendidivirga corallicola TaxID=3051826 RepID=A0ABT8KJH6_9BACT|nr:hypothetical protein [Fulvivirgaceae bacterium BMA10]
MKKVSIVIIIFSFLYPGCSNDLEIKFSLAGQTFDHLFFETKQACLDAQPYPDFFLNCHQSLEFLDGREAHITFTDIINKVSYSFHRNQIVLSPKGSTEFTNRIVFDIIDENTLRLTTDDTIWKRRKGESIWD